MNFIDTISIFASVTLYGLFCLFLVLGIMEFSDWLDDRPFRRIGKQSANIN